MNPAALEGQPPRHDAGFDAARQRRHVRHAQPRQGRLRRRTRSRDGSLANVPRLRGPDDLDHDRGDQAARREAARRRALEELLRARAHLLDVHPPDRAARSTGSRTASRNRPAGARGQHRRVPRRRTTSARPPSCSTTPTRSSPRSSPPGTYRNITGNVALSYGLVAAAQQGEAAALLRVVPDHARLRHPARAVEAQELRREDAAGRRRDRRRGRGGRRRVRRAASRSPARAVPVST